MREILFRGKTKHGEWVEGWFVGKTRKALYNPPQEKTAIISQDLYCYDVIPETVGQYTELTDRNGKKIFEGDIVAMELETTTVTGIVKYQGAAFYIATNSDLWEIDNYITLEVIGNIHDNPELLNK